MPSIDWAGKAAEYLHLGADATAARGTLLASLGSAVQAEIERYCNRTLDVLSYTEVYDGNGMPRIYLRHDPVVSLTSVLLDGTALTVGAATTYPLPDVTVRGESCISRANGNVFPLGSTVVVTYDAGYAVAPPEIVQAGVSWIALLFKERDRAGLSSENVGGQTTAFDRKMPPFVELVLNNFRRGYVPTC